MMRFITLALSLLVGALAYAQPADPTNLPKVAVLELELGKGIKNNVIARDDFRKLSAEELVVVPVPGERPDNLVALFSCEAMNTSCLKQVASSLKVQYILFGFLEVAGSGEKLLVSLYDANADKILSIEEATYLADTRSADMQKTIRKALRVDGAATIRKAQKIEVNNNPKTPKDKKPSGGGWKYAVPAVSLVAWGVLGASAQNKTKGLSVAEGGDGERSIDEAKQIKGLAAGSDIMFGVAVGSGLWAFLSNKKNKPTTEQPTASNP
jgi:hypothetical protein